ncbi:MAG: Tm-1-like ATP-binding domain-containing protein [Opitutales bacterium]|nr:Tm-1-like ATP-binding domain-containing protein [Opitutales bacterium]
MATIAVLGTLDTKAEEHAFVAEIITQRGHIPLLIDVGSLNPPGVAPDIPRKEIAEAAGVKMRELDDRGKAVEAMGKGAASIVGQLVAEGRINGIISLGGGGGTSIGTTAMRALPIGFPKLMVSTLAASENAPVYMGVKDVTLMPSIVDVAGLNRISRKIFTNAAGAICGMVESTPAPSTNEKPIIVASMFGNTTECVNHAKAILEAEGYEVLVFHATGTGGRTMESLVETGMVSGVLDITTTEMADELAGGILSAGPNRLMAAALNGIPTIVTPGCLDMVNFGAMDSIPKKYAGRTFYEHNPQVTLMRTTPSESAELGRRLAEKANLSTGPVTLLFPRRAISIISAKGQPFHDPAADAALLESIRGNLREDIKLIEMDCTINDPEFAEACAQQLLESLKQAI